MRRTGEGHYVAEFGDRIEGEDDEVAVEAAGNLVKSSELGNLPSPFKNGTELYRGTIVILQLSLVSVSSPTITVFAGRRE